jgi:uncharacterized membrane protein
MIRWLLWLLGGVLLGGIVHLSTVLYLPRTATQDAYSRLTPITTVNTVVTLPSSSMPTATLPFMDPAFATAVCRYDLSLSSLKLTTPISPAYTSVSFYTRHGLAYYAINDRAAGRRIIELELMTPAQHNQLPEEEDITAADRLIIESPTSTGLIVIRTMVTETGQLPTVLEILSQAKCQLQQQQSSK